eukprot:2070729-Pyramimonas_sp.AAC.1
MKYPSRKRLGIPCGIAANLAIWEILQSGGRPAGPVWPRSQSGATWRPLQSGQSGNLREDAVWLAPTE